MLDHLRRLVAVAVSAGAMTLFFSSLPLGAQEPKVPLIGDQDKACSRQENVRPSPSRAGLLWTARSNQRAARVDLQSPGQAYAQDRGAGKADRGDPSPEPHGVRGDLDRLAEADTRTKARERRAAGGQQNNQRPDRFVMDTSG